MSTRPIDIARKLGVSTATLRHYEKSGMVPAVMRSQNGYRLYTDEHVAYFICIREMMRGFFLPEIEKMLKLVIENKIDEALWMANKAQTMLRKEKSACEQIKIRFLQKKKAGAPKEFTVDFASKFTGITASTIRYWDKLGLISANRCTDNNYRLFTQTQLDELLLIQALKLAMRARGEKYTVKQIREEMKQFNFEDTEKISAITDSIESHLSALNRAQIKSIYALYELCSQVEEKRQSQHMD